jgi:hypothetical protein
MTMVSPSRPDAIATVLIHGLESEDEPLTVWLALPDDPRPYTMNEVGVAEIGQALIDSAHRVRPEGRHLEGANHP